MIHSALVALKPAESLPKVIDYAVDLARRQSWQLDGLAVIDVDRISGAEPVPLGGGEFKAQRDRHLIELTRHQAGLVVEAFNAACSAQSVAHSGQTCEGDIAGSLARSAHRADLLICGHTTGGDSSERSLLQSVLKHFPRPALVIPSSEVKGNDVLVAYDGTFQADRAIASFANSGLARDRTVHVLSLHERAAVAEQLATAAVDFLRRHGIKAIPRADILKTAPGDQIVAAVQQLPIGLLVMGAFGRNVVSEFFFGSATQTVLSRLPIPVLLDH